MYTIDSKVLLEHAPGHFIASCVFSGLMVACILAFFVVLIIARVKYNQGKDVDRLLVAVMILFAVVLLCFFIDANLTVTAYQRTLREILEELPRTDLGNIIPVPMPHPVNPKIVVPV